MDFQEAFEENFLIIWWIWGELTDYFIRSWFNWIRGLFLWKLESILVAIWICYYKHLIGDKTKSDPSINNVFALEFCKKNLWSRAYREKESKNLFIRDFIYRWKLIHFHLGQTNQIKPNTISMMLIAKK